MDTTKAKKLWRTKRAQIQMLQARGYDITDVEAVKSDLTMTRESEADFVDPENPLSFGEFEDWYLAPPSKGADPTLSAIYSRKNDQSIKTYVHYIPTIKNNQIGKDDIAPLLEVVDILVNSEDETLDCVIVVIDRAFSSSARDHLEKTQGVKFQYFQLGDIHPPTHILQPLHELVSDEEKNDLLAEMPQGPSNTDILRNLPKIFEGDPVVKYYGWKAGKLVKISRRGLDGTFVEKQISYALIVPGNPIVPKALSKFI